MKKFLPLLTIVLALTACGSSTDVTSQRTPKGNPNARVVLAEYADLQCPACKRAHSDIAAILARYGEDIRYEFNHFPLRAIHPYAQDAAEMSECVAQQGVFWEFIDIAFENQDDLSKEVLGEWAAVAGANRAEAEKCLKNHDTRDAVLASYKQGRALGVQGTPSFFVNGERVEYAELVPAIEKAIEETTMPL